MKCRFLGGAEEVGRVGLLVESGDTRVLFDYGYVPGRPPLFPGESPKVSAVLLTHAHIDHSGMIPWLARRYRPRVYAVGPTAEMSQLLYADSVKISDTEGLPLPYGTEDVKASERIYNVITYKQELQFDGFTVIPRFAGHIPGAAMFEIQWDKKILFSGDLNTVNTRLVGGATPVKTDVLFIEGTYAGREHPDRRELEKEFLDRIDEVLYQGGKVIVPAFAVGRTQEMMLLLYKTGYEVWVDGMGKAVNEILRYHPGYVRNMKQLKSAERSVNMVYSPYGRKLALKGDIIITTSGMLDGGPVIEYLRAIKNDPKSAILLTGYQVEGTNGRLLLEKGAVNMYGVTERISSQVYFYDFSAHAGNTQLVEFVRNCSPEKVVVYHSDNRQELAEQLSEFDVVLPSNNEGFTL